VMLKQNAMNVELSSHSASSLSMSSSPNPMLDDEDESDSNNFDLFHLTTPRRKCAQQQPFENIIARIHDRYRKQTAQNSAYCKLKKKQLRIEQFYKEKVADKHSIALLVEDDKIHFLQNWNSGKRGLKMIKNSIDKIEKDLPTTKTIIDGGSSSQTSEMKESEEFKQSIAQQTEFEDADDECLSDEDDASEQSEDDSDASMDSDTLKRILFESSMQLKQKRKQQKVKSAKRSKTTKHKMSKKKKKKDSKNTTCASLKPPSNQSKKDKKKKTNSKKKKISKRNNKKRKQKTPRFMQKCQTPQRASHKLKLCDINGTDNEDKKRKKKMRIRKRKRSINVDILYVDRNRRMSDDMSSTYQRLSINKASHSDVGVLGSEYFGTLHSPQYRRLSKNCKARMVPMTVLDFGKDDK